MKRLKMFPQSIRRRLPLSYAGVALLTALVLGVVLLSALRLYYREREAEYLARSASTIEATLAQSMSAGAPSEDIQDQVIDLAYLTETRIQLLDAGGSAIADSGLLNVARLRLLALQERTSDLGRGLTMSTVPGGQDRPDSLATIEPLATATAGRLPGGLQQGTRAPLVIPRIEDLYTFMPRRDDSEYQSNLSTTLTVRDIESGETLGYVVVSGAPNYSSGILSGVALAWALAASVAVLLAALVGWLASRQISRPLLGLTEVTARMADGDLTVRAEVSRQDEFGALAQSFNHMAGRLQAFVHTLQRFVADAAHELNTPLTALRNSLDLALEGEDRAAQAALIEAGRSQVGRLEELAHDLLDLSRLESGEAGRDNLPVDLLKVALKLSEVFASQAEEAGQAFTLLVPPEDSELMILGDELQLRRALAGVLDNAIKFTPEGGTVELGVSATELWVSIRVVDSGIGIPDEDLPHITSRFHRGRNASRFAGNGLGLAIVKAVVGRHGGRMMIRSTEGQGTSVSLDFPRRSQ